MLMEYGTVLDFAANSDILQQGFIATVYQLPYSHK